MGNQLYGYYAFAQTLCAVLGDCAYVVVGRMTGQTNAVLTYGNWAGQLPGGTVSLAPHIAYGKFGELVLLDGGRDGNLVMTPVPGNEQSYGWMGGVAQKGVIVAVSKWAPEHDRLLALLTLYHAVHQGLILHHTGFRFSERANYESKNALFRNGMDRPAVDHERTYFRVDNVYREHQFFPYGPWDDARHWDFVCQDPDALLYYIAIAYGRVPVFFDDVGPHDPVGVVWVQAKNGSKLGVMARKKWWNVEEG